MKDQIIDYSVTLLVGIISLVLILAIIMSGLGFIISIAIGGVRAVSITSVANILSSIAIIAGVFIAILTFLRDRDRLAREKEENRSNIFLDQARNGLDEVLELLKDKNNNRVIWIRAARVLLDAVSISKQIRAPEYVKAYRLYEDKIRSELYRSLTLYNEETQERESLPPQFFYGIKDWHRNISLDDAAIEASSEVKLSEVTIDKVLPDTSLTQLEPKAVVAIFNFLEYPTDYTDSLKSVQLWTDNWEDSYGHIQGAKRYIAHTKLKSVHAGKIYTNDMKD